MNTSPRAKASGRPFVKGDPRIQRNTKGPVCKERQAFAIEFNNAIAKRADIPKLVEKLVGLAEKGCEWAMKEVLDRTMGKVTQPVETDQNILYRIIYDAASKDKE